MCKHNSQCSKQKQKALKPSKATKATNTPMTYAERKEAAIRRNEEIVKAMNRDDYDPEFNYAAEPPKVKNGARPIEWVPPPHDFAEIPVRYPGPRAEFTVSSSRSVKPFDIEHRFSDAVKQKEYVASVIFSQMKRLISADYPTEKHEKELRLLYTTILNSWYTDREFMMTHSGLPHPYHLANAAPTTPFPVPGTRGLFSPGKQKYPCSNCKSFYCHVSYCPFSKCTYCHHWGHGCQVCEIAKSCFNCGKYGHDAEHCKRCKICHIFGHNASQCPKKTNRVCNNCGRPGHTARTCKRCEICDQFTSVSHGMGGSVNCDKGKHTHYSRYNVQRLRDEGKVVKCSKCHYFCAEGDCKNYPRRFSERSEINDYLKIKNNSHSARCHDYNQKAMNQYARYGII